jgi:succinyl-diaminopimelate desuccinylase
VLANIAPPVRSPVTVRGVLREVDLERHSCQVFSSAKAYTDCEFDESHEQVVKDALDCSVRIVGEALVQEAGARRKVLIRDIEIESDVASSVEADSSRLTARALLDSGLQPELGVGIAVVADEEAGSDFGIKYLIRRGLFGKDDLFYVPDAGEADGSVIEVAEKSIIWLKITVKGKQVHASTPKKGLNALRVGSEMLLFLADQLAGHFPAEDKLFYPTGSTFEPTKRLANVENINTVPGEDVTFFDIRLLPQYDPEECVKVAKEVGTVFERRSGATIDVEAIRIDPAGKASCVDGEGAKALTKAVRRVLGVQPSMMGIGGQTCANWFRQEGLDSYVWETLDEMAHQANEYTKIDNLVNDTKVFTVLLAQLCYPGQFKETQPEY